MAKSYVVNITDGTGSEIIPYGEYNVTATAIGYDEGSINPALLAVVEGTDSYDLTIAATGTLVLHVTDDGTDIGTPIVGAVFYRCDAEGVTYGDEIVSDDSGNATFNNVPYALDGAPVVYYKQTASDSTHDFDTQIYNETLTEESTTVEIMNAPANTKTINLTDANYSGLPIGTAEITLSE